VAAPALGIAPGVVAGVSAGAAFACAAFANRIDDVLREFKQRAAANERNVYPTNALAGQPVFPHEAIYRGTIMSTLDDAAMKRLHEGPEIRILLARPPGRLGQRAGFVIGGIAYALDRRELRVHPRWGRRFGFEPEVVPVSTCRRPEELADLILHSSCSPPLVPLYRREQRIVLDGGLIDNAPVGLVGPARRALVMLSRHYREDQKGRSKTPSVPGRTYVQPSQPVPVVKWDYTSPNEIQQTFDLGRRDGEAFATQQISGQGAQDAPLPKPALDTNEAAIAL
jgi:predicted acylesterase/phospholipase RssA